MCIPSGGSKTHARPKLNIARRLWLDGRDVAVEVFLMNYAREKEEGKTQQQQQQQQVATASPSSSFLDHRHSQDYIALLPVSI